MSEELEIPQRPAFAELPLRKDGPRGNAWGLFGDKDALGLLNYITPDITRAAAAAEIVHGLRVATDLPLDFFKIPAFGRIPFSHQINQLIDHAVNDDVITLNTQSASQWDGLGHFGSLTESPATIDRILIHVLRERVSRPQAVLQWANPERR